MVADPLGMLMDSKEYLAPLITPWEAALAFTGQSLGPQYSFDFRDVMVGVMMGSFFIGKLRAKTSC